VGQGATIKLETFPFTRYGTLPAQVVAMAADAVVDDQRGAVFPAMLVFQHTDLRTDGGSAIRLAPGMNLSAEIKTGHRRVIDYLLSPVRQVASESMGER
jgi:hemolysin D